MASQREEIAFTLISWYGGFRLSPVFEQHVTKCVREDAKTTLMEAIMRFKKRNLVAVMSCVMMFAAAPLLPAELSVMASAYAKEGGNGNGGGNGGGGGGGNGNGGHGGESGGHAGASHSDSSHSRGLAEGHETDHDGKAVRDHGAKGVRDHGVKGVRDHGVKGHHTGRGHKTSRGHGAATSGVAHSKATRGLSKATAISDTKVGDHNDKGLGQAASSTAK